MSEYSFVEKPFLDQLHALAWTVIDQGPGIPTDPTKSLRASFREVTLRDVFNQAVRAINTTADGRTWLTDKQLDDLHDDLFSHSGRSLVENNEAVLKLLFRSQVDANEWTGEQYPNVKLIDFEHPDRNQFHAVNQFRIDTPGAGRGFIIPDIVLFVNGLPLAVIECKEANVFTSNPMFEAFQQLMRYSNQREETKQSGLREGEPRLFFTNQLLIRTSGEQADIGTITSTDEEFFFPWRDIYPEKYRTFTPPLGKVRPQETLIQGVLPKETLLDLIRTCSIFMDVGKVRAKVVARYQQYRAVCKIIDRLRKGKTPNDRSGVIWHTQGSGKSLTMVFVIRKLRMCDDLKDYKVCLVNDRTDLEVQLGDTAALTGEKVTFITSSYDLKQKLATESSNLNMVMLHKFNENQNRNVSDYLQDVIDLPKYESFGLVNASERILLMIDEAHRSQSGDLGDNLFEAFPQATRLAFTGTPLIVVKDQQKTIERFGRYIDKYRLQDAVDDGVTVQILYEGKTADSAISHKAAFDQKVNDLAAQHVASQMRKAENVETLRQIANRENRKFDDLMKERTAEEILALKKKWGTSDDLFEAEPRIKEIASDLVGHYIANILPNGFKAQVVCSSKLAAVRYKKFIDEAVAERLATEEGKPIWAGKPEDLPEDRRASYRDEELCKRIGFLKSVVVVSSEGTNERAIITQARKHAIESNAVENFKKKFDYIEPDKANTGIAFLVVCDMLLTGFDAPIEQVMYIDKRVKDHNLLQTIARVNRIAKGKTRGYIVDYIGLTDHLKSALSIYAADDQKDVESTLTDITGELPVLETRYRRLLNLFVDNGVVEIGDFVQQQIKNTAHELAVLEKAIRCMEDLAQRANFEVFLKKFLQSMDIILPNAEAFPYRIPAKRFGFLLVKIKERYKDDSLSISGAGEKVRKLIDEHLVSLGINPKIPPVELLSPNFVKQLDKNTTPQAKASEMEHAIRKHCKVHFDEDPVLYESLSEKLEALIKQYKDNWDLLSQHLFDLRKDAEAGRKDDPQGVSKKAAPFYDLIGKIAFGRTGISQEHGEQAKQLVIALLSKLNRTIGIVNFWGNPPEVAKLRGELSDLLLFSGIDAIADKSDKIVTEITALAKVREKDILE
ncbi:Type I restriction enzyme R protein [Anatilimnocola aggregata]|uniref:Type I restriction enzyme endonuclease subunit n=1 Tax=Anatilimnocola aggregata TaxID=2528021 RepID=A0A517Y6J3_9BACT|nr:HsdR family type I site-specific deoxyribonuclease [Anatilimnocola aggregata]QDU25853.1 Type I restriction enzyme R protein [Anatilimnocola aggregata]